MKVKVMFAKLKSMQYRKPDKKYKTSTLHPENVILLTFTESTTFGLAYEYDYYSSVS